MRRYPKRTARVLPLQVIESKPDVLRRVVLKGPCLFDLPVEGLPGGMAGGLLDAPLRFARADRLRGRARTQEGVGMRSGRAG